MEAAQLLSLIQKTPDVCGGDACIRNSRIMVWLLVAMMRDGMAEEQILYNYPGLTTDDLAAAWEYYKHNRQEIDEAIANQEVEDED
jgi:uncharacterized protein (DUF433 family)